MGEPHLSLFPAQVIILPTMVRKIPRAIVKLFLGICTETANKDGMWLRENSSCCCLTTAGKNRQLLFNKIYIPFLPSLYMQYCVVAKRVEKGRESIL